MAITFLNGFRIGPTELYPFSSFTFTTTGISGSTGPTYNQLMVAYTGSTSGSYFSNPTFFTTGAFNGNNVIGLFEPLPNWIEPLPLCKYNSPSAILMFVVPLLN